MAKKQRADVADDKVRPILATWSQFGTPHDVHKLPMSFVCLILEIKPVSPARPSTYKPQVLIRLPNDIGIYP